MICSSCKKSEHKLCTNPPTCTCQHRRAKRLENGTIAPIREDGVAIVLQKGQEG